MGDRQRIRPRYAYAFFFRADAVDKEKGVWVEIEIGGELSGNFALNEIREYFIHTPFEGWVLGTVSAWVSYEKRFSGLRKRGGRFRFSSIHDSPSITPPSVYVNEYKDD